MESSLHIPHLPEELQQLSWSDKVAYLAWKIRQGGGAKPEDIPVEHIFEPGRYVREMKLPNGHLFIGRFHMKGHIVLLMEGSAKVITEFGSTIHTGPDAMLTLPGFQMVAWMLTDVRVRTIHPNPSGTRDVEELEDQIFEPVEPVLLHGQAIADKIRGLLT